MKKATFTLLACIMALAVPAIARPADAPAADRGGPATFGDDLAKACGDVRPALAPFAGECLLSTLARREIVLGIAEYSFRVRAGADEHTVIGMHRVVRESAPFVPSRTRDAVLMAHGDAWGFDGAFLASAASPAVPDAHALPVFLAQNGVDVWGIDFAWTLLPPETADFSFFHDWGIATDASHLDVALAVARAARRAGGDGFGKIDLLGWSRGGQTGYAYLSEETQVPSGHRQVNGFIPVDIYLKTDVESLRQAACTRAAAEQASFDAGNLASTVGILFSTLGTLAEAAPADPSPVLPGFTNFQAGLFAGSATFAFTEPAPFYHFVGGTFDGTGLPTGLLYTGVTPFFDFERGASPYEPARIPLEGDVVICDQGGVSFDDHLAEIRVPVLYLGAGGGFGTYGLYTTTLLGSHDVTAHVASLLPPEQRLADLGHADIFNADDAESLFWQPVLDWIRGH
jgi:hypothetical protein